MEFGQADSDELDKIDFSLPPEPETNVALFKRLPKREKTKVYVGCSKWGRKDWVGKLYPPKSKTGDYLKHYGKQLDCVELNSTFYGTPSLEEVSKWRDDVGENFVFCPKIPQTISHYARLVDCDAATTNFLRSIAEFKEKLGTVFLLLPPNFTPKNLNALENYLSKWPLDVPLGVEFRHPELFKSPHFETVMNLFEAYNIASIITDAAARRDCTHMRLTNGTAFVRFVGNSLHPTDYTRCDEWISKLIHWIDAGLERIYFFMHMHDELYSPELCSYMIKKLNKLTELNLREPVINQNLSLL